MYLAGCSKDVLIRLESYPVLHWTDAVEYCNQTGGYLPVIANEHDRQYILQERTYLFYTFCNLF